MKITTLEKPGAVNVLVIPEESASKLPSSWVKVYDMPTKPITGAIYIELGKKMDKTGLKSPAQGGDAEAWAIARGQILADLLCDNAGKLPPAVAFEFSYQVTQDCIPSLAEIQAEFDRLGEPTPDTSS